MNDVTSYDVRMLTSQVRRIADALERAYPPPPKPKTTEDASSPKGRTAGRRGTRRVTVL